MSLASASSVASLIEIVCDGGPRCGYGHLRRSSALAEVLVARGFRVRISPRSAAARRLIASGREPGRPDVIVFDLPDTAQPAIADTRRRGIPTVALDYFGPDRPTLTLSVRERPPVPPGRRDHGIELAIVRAPIRELAARSPAAGDGVLVILGGADVRGRSAAIARAVRRLEDDVTVVLGPYAPAIDDAGGARVVRDPADLPGRMAACRWAVSSGGVTLTELLCLGKPAYVAPQTAAERDLVRPLAARGAIFGVGDEPARAPTEAERLDIAAAARAVVDGRGADRIADRISDLCGRRHHV